MTLPTILAFVGQNANQALHWASAGLGGLFGTYGLRTAIINLNDADYGKQLERELRGGSVLFAFGFAGIGASLEGERGNFWDGVGIPFLSLLYDHPAYIIGNHRLPARYVYNCYHVRDFYEAQRDYVRSSQPARLFPQSFAFNPPARQRPWAQRDSHIVYLKTGENPAALTVAWADKPPVVRECIQALIRAAQQRTDFYLTDYLALLFQQAGLVREVHDKEFWYCLQQADRYIRAWRSDQMARALQPFPALIYGGGWDYLSLQGQAQFRPAIDSTHMPELFASSRYVVNTNPFFCHGLHERTAYGLVSGCVTLTDANDAGQEIFGDLQHYVSFDWAGGLPALQDSIATLLRADNDVVAASMAAEARLLQHCHHEAMFQSFLEVVRHAREVVA